MDDREYDGGEMEEDDEEEDNVDDPGKYQFCVFIDNSMITYLILIVYCKNVFFIILSFIVPSTSGERGRMMEKMGARCRESSSDSNSENGKIYLL